MSDASGGDFSSRISPVIGSPTRTVRFDSILRPPHQPILAPKGGEQTFEPALVSAEKDQRP